MSKDGKHLQKLFERLSEPDRHTLLAFAEFLVGRADQTGEREPETLEPQLIPRPPKESVIAAVKRLSASYPMLEKSRLFNETSSLVSQHMLQGRQAGDVIDELEVLFERHYQLFCEGK